MKILLTGGTGFIGSHTCVELTEAGYDVVIADDLSNSNPLVLDRLKELTGNTIKFYNIDIADKGKMDEMFATESFDAVIHFAGFKAVGESV
ncbi:MAG: SDR family NAD(P)-dependent oxidoreductase, partial [Acutalibacteraceae bacterium]|nr:SDR family NAD(P)-dependent oxidoreductase [Acutalibacteraceae bacterium]